ncbi:hypothetical protein N7540_011320 [Penicillium herquei]|nr:hypothetical protein N7540_011320 [Penicillium herquei]
MPFQNLSSDSVIAGCTKVIQTGLEGSKLALQKSTDLTTQVGVYLMYQNSGADESSWGAQNPTLAICAAVGASGAVILAVPGGAAAPILSGIGFKAGGIQAGSMAAAFHSSIGNIIPGSAFAIVQSAGAGGSGLAVVNGVAQVGGVAMTMGSAGIAWVKAKL